MKKLGYVCLVLSVIFFGYMYYDTQLKLDLTTSSLENSYVKKYGDFTSSYKFTHLTVLSVTKTDYSRGTWKVSADEKNIEVVTVLAKYTGLDRAISELNTSSLFIESYIVDTVNETITFSVRVKGVDKWTLPL